MNTFADRLAFGRTAEETVADILKRRFGCHVVPVYDYNANNKAPKLHGFPVSYVVPDLDVSKDGERSWVEVKAKSNSGCPTRVTGQIEHGFAWRLFRQYQEVQRITGTPVYIVILETVSGDILFQSLDELDRVKRIYSGDKMDRGGTAFFPRTAFQFLCNVAENAP
ncbi:MAG: hypothetical protein HQL34_05280 [Alphaproteobacteria bacterium]|nr:hypothetical protein [Alphaproteobacteria bacterium]